MVSRTRRAACAHSRSCQPATITGLEAPSAISTVDPVSAATELTPSASVTGLRTPAPSGPSRSGKPGTRWPIAVPNAKAS